MPFTSKDALGHSKKANTPAKQKLWAKVANGALKRCMGADGASEEKCDASAIKVANALVGNVKESDMKLAELAQSALEIGLALARGTDEVSRDDGRRLLESYQGDIDAALLEMVDDDTGNAADVMTIEVEGERVPLADLIETYSQTKKQEDGDVYNLTVNTAGGETLSEAIAGSLRDFASRVEDAFRSAFEPATLSSVDKSATLWARDVFYQHPDLGDAIIARDDDGGLFAVEYTQTDDGFEFTSRQEWTPVVLTYVPVETTAEAIETDGVAVNVARDATAEDTAALSESETALVETGRRAPVVIDFLILQPGPGNKRQNHFYPQDVVERDIHVFKDVDVFATDHKESERSERTKVGKVIDVPTRFTESQAPVAQVLIYDPHQAEKARNRNDAGALDTLECSIFGNGKAKKGKVDGKEYKIVETITDGRYLELVSKAGAGGRALNLAENITGGQAMEKDEKTKAAPVETKVEEVAIEESTAEVDEQETVVKEDAEQVLAESAVNDALDKTKLPAAFRKALTVATYENDEQLGEAIKEAIAEVKALTGSGQVFGQGQTVPVKTETLSEEEKEQKRLDRFNAIMREVGAQEV